VPIDATNSSGVFQALRVESVEWKSKGNIHETSFCEHVIEPSGSIWNGSFSRVAEQIWGYEEHTWTLFTWHFEVLRFSKLRTYRVMYPVPRKENTQCVCYNGQSVDTVQEKWKLVIVRIIKKQYACNLSDYRSFIVQTTYE
jgi:hypothetical protein